MTPFQRIMSKLKQTPQAKIAAQTSDRPKKTNVVLGSKASDELTYFAIDGTFLRAAKIRTGVVILVDEERIIREVINHNWIHEGKEDPNLFYEHYEHWFPNAQRTALEMTKNSWWHAPDIDCENYYGPFFSQEEAMEDAEENEMIFQGKVKCIHPAFEITEAFVKDFIHNLSEEVEDMTSPLEEDWDSYWRGKADYKAIADEMRKAMKKEMDRQGLKCYSISEPHEQPAVRKTNQAED